MSKIVSQEELKKLCEEWRERLRLQAWDVDVGIYRASEFEIPNCCGENEWGNRNYMSTIRILDPVDYPKSNFKQDMEITLVHELLHLHFEAFEPKDKDTLQYDIMERTIDRLAHTMVELKRQAYSTEGD